MLGLRSLARGRPVAVRGRLQSLQLSVETFDVPSCLLHIHRVVVLCFRGSARWIHESVCASVSVIVRPCGAWHSACFVLRLLATAAPRGTAGASTCAPRARDRHIVKLRGRRHLYLTLGRLVPLCARQLATYFLYRAGRSHPRCSTLFLYAWQRLCRACKLLKSFPPPRWRLST